MHFTLLGATGPTGQRIQEQALNAGHHVTALVRDPTRLPQHDDRITVVTGDATRTEDLTRAVSGSKAVLSALGAGRNLKSDIARRAAGALIPAAKDTGVTRLVVLSAFGVGDTLQHTSLVQGLAMKLLCWRHQPAGSAVASVEPTLPTSCSAKPTAKSGRAAPPSSPTETAAG